MAIDRRTVLRVAGLAAASTALGAWTASGWQQAESAPGQVDWPALRKRLQGSLLLPEDTGYERAKQAFNPRFDDRRPAAVAACGSVSDVQACVTAVAGTGVRAAARSGSHSYAGYSTPDDGLIIDVGALNTVEVRADGTAVIGAGARLMDVYSGLASAGRCLPGGSCPTVGIAGLTLGGGIGVLAGKYGLTCDSLVSAEIVTADGTLRIASADSEPDLFWALRGGGGGNFGVVTSFTFRTQPAPRPIVAELLFAAGSATAVLGGWQSFTANAPDEFWSTLAISAGAAPSCRISVCYLGTEPNLNSLLDKLISATGTQPADRSVTDMGYLQAMQYFGGCTNYAVAQCRPSWNGGGLLDRESFTASSRVLTNPLADPDRLTALLTGRTGMDILLDSLAGAVSRIGPADTAFPHRGALATAQIYVGGITAADRTAVAEVRDGLGQLVGDTGFVNYIDPDLKDWGRAYYGANATRLRKVADRYDPAGVFDFAQSVSKL